MSRKIVILGAGESGTGAAILANVKGFDVFVSDNSKIKAQYKRLLEKHGIAYEENKHTEEKILSADEVIKSPGIPADTPLMKKIRKQNIPVISEIEFASRFTKAKMICITGSNGKTTTTLMTYEIFKNAGLNVALAGNVGKSFALQVAEKDYDYYILEISSFQLDDMYDFKADTAILLNITPDHLDRYDNDFSKYLKSKFRITQNQTSKDTFIYNYDDMNIRQNLNFSEANKLPFSLTTKFDEGAFLDDLMLKIRYKDDYFEMLAKELSLRGKHNIYNSMAAALAAKIHNITNPVIRKTLAGFKNVEHRLENVLTIRGIHFVNDSKATNVNSVWYALEAIDKDIVLIMGGLDKGNDYSLIKNLVKEKVKAIVALGIDNTKIINYFKDIVDVHDTNSMSEAVLLAYQLADTGDTVLLSPACASFDLFDNYIDRGNKFKKAVRSL